MKNAMKNALAHATEIQNARRATDEKRERELEIARDNEIREIERKNLSELQKDIKNLYLWSASYANYQCDTGLVWAENIVAAQNTIIEMYENDYFDIDMERVAHTLKVRELDLDSKIVVAFQAYE